ncbi:salicylic acid-binding protein 2-like isoform X2 [Hibiscus syriacus]|uniref:salicylic acid-binding protein 2-like isoform X2 n=1 Tax=Hibiscus syriacus TaxID=106335 RepID=UPI001924D76B|nr:salicylic acid-binding protein 2-like isoform X2 [Hibiscus syriacus]
MAEVKKKKHFILIHGACHGAWCWYKLKPRLESAGHRVTAVDMAASGINTNQIQAVHSMYEYTKPLLEILASLPDDEKAILVGHSLGGLNLALAMDKYPQKISAAVFLTAFMPDTAHKPSFVLEQYWGRTPPEAWLDTQFAPYGEPEESLMSMFFGPKFLTFKLYQLSPVEVFKGSGAGKGSDQARIIVRSRFIEDKQVVKRNVRKCSSSVHCVQ